MRTHDTWDLRLEDVHPRRIDVEDDFGLRQTIERGLLLLVVVAVVVLVGAQLVASVGTWSSDIRAALTTAAQL